ncbi:MAG: 1-acyl-sn-glycerol-3-phosphate acyltransferase [Verrucomicrobiales bacterium]|nr:1-acyl-sn-glycerol-3-phosphate acyltransferase [Verrucomicrobiales bacterium]
MARRPLRTSLRLARFLWFHVTSVRDFRRTVAPEEERGTNYRLRAEWTQRHARRLCRILDWTVETEGAPPDAAIYGANHLGYTDIVMMAAATPVVFVSKSEVRRWPMLGSLAACAGTLFLNRERKEDLLVVSRQFEPITSAGVPVVVFLEGTSSNGDSVLPFRPSLLAPAVQGNWKVAPVGIQYDVTPGTVAQDVAWWGDMEFLPHFLNLLARDSVRSRVTFGDARASGGDRKQLARELHSAVVALRSRPMRASAEKPLPKDEPGLAATAGNS